MTGGLTGGLTHGLTGGLTHGLTGGLTHGLTRDLTGRGTGSRPPGRGGINRLTHKELHGYSLVVFWRVVFGTHNPAPGGRGGIRIPPLVWDDPTNFMLRNELTISRRILRDTT